MKHFKRSSTVRLIFLVLAGLGYREAFARTYDSYRSDYPKGAFCSAIAGACASDDDLENSFFQNPSALTSKGPDWNFDGDFQDSSNLEPGVRKSKDISEQNFMGGIGWGGEQWGIGLSFTGRNTRVIGTTAVQSSGGTRQVFATTARANSLQFNLPVSYRVSSHLSVGASLIVSSFSENLSADPSAGTFISSNNDRPRVGVSVGFIESLNANWRVGSWFRSAIANRTQLSVDSDAVSPPVHSQEEFLVNNPWILATGASWMPWADSRTLLFDVDVIGKTSQGDLLGYYAPQSGGNLTPKGRRITFEPRLGYRMPYAHEARGTIHTGLYYEPSRRPEFGGRVHVTGGLSYHVLSWLELMAGADVSRDFFQFFLTFR
ncbi:MAG: hypothetical protein H7222_17305 [Methylotenera sp.]|nr:hypothetical protein [Oligoflexia bacterium]